MNPIQILILLFLLLSFMLVLLKLKHNLPVRIFYIAQFIAGTVFVLSPDTCNEVANLLGVGRGTDLLLYYLIAMFYISVLMFTIKLRMIERRQTKILRRIALDKAKTGGNK